MLGAVAGYAAAQRHICSLISLLIYSAALLKTEAGTKFSKQRDLRGDTSQFWNSNPLTAAAQLQQLYGASKCLRGDLQPGCAQHRMVLRHVLASSTSAVLQVAAAPRWYDARVAALPISVAPPLNPPFNQRRCGMCVAAAVLAAAEAVMARALHMPAEDLQLSRPFFFFCTPGGANRSCESGWDIQSALDALGQQQIPLASCVNDTGWEVLPNPQSICTRQLVRCPQGSVTSRGLFRWRRLKDVWAAQDHIRQQIGVITQVTLHLNRSHQQGHRGAASTDGNHLLAYYRNNLPTAHYSLSGVDKDSNFVTDGHAVVLIGYDNQRRSWLVQSSWGPAFADRGSYWNPYNVSAIAPADELYGVQFLPFNAPQLPARRIERAPRSGCFYYTTQAGDFAQMVATHLFGVQLAFFLQDNVGEIQAMEQFLTPGLRLLVCGGTTSAAAAAAEDLRLFPASSTKGRFIRGLPVGMHPGLAVAPAQAHSGAQGTISSLQVLKTLSSFDGRLLYLAYGPLRRVCVWQRGGLVALQLVHGSYTAPVQGELASGGVSRVQQQCIGLAPDERVVKLLVATGLTFVQGLTFTTSNSRVASVGHVGEGGNHSVGLKFAAFAAPPGGHLAGLSGWLFKVVYGDGDGWYDALCGLRPEWVVESS